MQASASELSPKPKQAEGLSIASLGIAQICSWGTLYYSFPQLAEEMMAEFAWSKSQVYGALTVSLLFSAMAALPIGRAIDKGRGRQVMTAGSLLAGLLFISGSQLEALWSFYAIFAGIGFLHAATLYDATFSVIANRFEPVSAKKHIITLTLWGGFASTLFIPLIEWLLQWGGWRNTMIVLGLVNIFLCSAIYWRLPAPSRALREKNPEKEEKISTPINVRWALKQPMFWSLLCCFSLFAAAATTFKFHLYPILMEKGLPAIEVVAIIAVLGPSQVAGRVLLALFSEKLSIVNLGILTASTLPIVFIAFAFLPASMWMLIPFAVAFGAASGTMTIVKGIAIPELLTKESYGVINGAMNIPVKVINAFSPSVAAAVWYVNDSYAGVFILLAILGVAAAVSFALATKIQSPHCCDMPDPVAS